MSPGDEGPHLLALARGAVSEAFGGPTAQLPEYPALRQRLTAPAATFVTIRLGGQLHGCIGTITPVRSLVDDLRHNAVAAAFHDPRTRRLEPSELDEAHFEVSVLGPTEALPCASYAEALERVRPNVDGVVVASGRHRGVFLPQVWTQLPTVEAFLDALWRKAGMEPGSWPQGTTLERFGVQKYAEANGEVGPS